MKYHLEVIIRNGGTQAVITSMMTQELDRLLPWPQNELKSGTLGYQALGLGLGLRSKTLVVSALALYARNLDTASVSAPKAMLR